MPEYIQTTNSITVKVNPIYLDNESVPGEEHYIWVYHIKLENKSDKAVQLVNRYWHIMDSEGRVQEVRGPGVVGLQPVIKPGESFEYASGTHLPTPSGIMSGLYEMKSIDAREEKARLFNIVIPTFSLDSTDQLKRPN